MASSAAKRVCVLGVGSMGSAVARRLRDCGYGLSVWNRSQAKAQALVSEQSTIASVASPTPATAVQAASPSLPVFFILTDTAAVLSTLRSEGMGAALGGRVLVNLTSGNPDEGREIQLAVDEVSQGARLIDGAYCGPPAKARMGAGQLFLSSASSEAVETHRELLGKLGSVTFAGGVGASRALDYAVVDLFFVNVLSFMSNKEALAREGVDIKQVCEEVKKRLDTVPAALELYDRKMASRREDDYASDTTVTLRTARSYWASRLPYNEARGIPSHLTDLFLELLDSASGGREGPHADADLARLQEVVRYGVHRGGASAEEPEAKRTKVSG